MIPVPEEAIEERFLAATGPGGQNVNKVATACQLRCRYSSRTLEADIGPPFFSIRASSTTSTAGASPGAASNAFIRWL